MKICIIASHKNSYAPNKIMEAGKKRGHAVHLTTWEDLCLNLGSEEIYFGDKFHSLSEFDAIIPRSDRYNILIDNKRVTRHLDTIFRLAVEYAEAKKIFFLNSNYFSKYQSLDKLSQQFFFFSNNFPGIETSYFSDISKVKKSKTTISYPLVAKATQGSTGTGIFKLNNLNELKKFIDSIKRSHSLPLFQKYHPINCDYRVIVIGKKVLGIMKRSPKKGEWRTNFSLGGDVERERKDKKIERLCLDLARKMGFDYVGVDILKDSKKLHLIETNSLPQFKGFEQCFPEINVAEEIIKLTEAKVKKLKSARLPTT